MNSVLDRYRVIRKKEGKLLFVSSALNALSVIWIPDISFRLNSDQCVSLTVYWRISNCMGAVWRIWVQSWASKLNLLCKGHQMFTYRKVNRVLKTWILCFTGQWNTPVKLWASTIWYNALTLNIKCAFFTLAFNQLSGIKQLKWVFETHAQHLVFKSNTPAMFTWVAY